MIPMFQLNGTVVHVYVQPKGISKKTGEEYGGQDKVQIMGDIPLDEGQTKKELVSLTTDQGRKLEELVGQQVSFPVAMYASGKSIGYYIPKGHQIRPRRSA